MHLSEKNLIDIMARAIWVAAAREGVIAVEDETEWTHLPSEERRKWANVAARVIDARDLVDLAVELAEEVA